jgi:putative ABC transport system substrate-binding protein
MRHVGLLMNLSENDLEAQRLVMTFREGLAQLGWADDRNLHIEYRWAGGDLGRIKVLAKELVELSRVRGHLDAQEVACECERRLVERDR